ncbi:MAG: sugar phosphate isomerase/epimerase [Spirochaetales bacterium]|nr:sugar phosphate isomerase/epimerase [Spirochaetales bacterium]
MSELKLGVITDGISQDVETAFKYLNEVGIEYADLQFIWDKEIGDQTDDEVKKIKKLMKEYNIKVGCLTRHNFAGLPSKMETLHSDAYNAHMEKYKRCFEIANELECPIVRIMSTSKNMILFGSHGAEKWVTATGAWDAQVELYREPVAYAEKMGTMIVTENCNGGQVTSNYLAKKLIDELGSDILKILWDPANAMYCTEKPYPDGYEAAGGKIGHIHIKDAKIDIAKAQVEFRSLGQGDMGPYLLDIANALKADNYEGIVSLEANYRPIGKDFIDGTRSSIDHFKKIFG